MYKHQQKIIEKFARVDSEGNNLLTPFVVSRYSKKLYLHIAKTGGTTITKILRNNSLDDHRLTNKKLSFEKKRILFAEIAHDWHDYFKFTFIRNKYDLLVSHWHYDNAKLKVSFSDFIKKVVIPSKGSYDYCIDQYYLTHMEEGKVFNFIGRYDTFKHDLRTVMGMLDIKKYDDSVRLNVGTYDHKKHFSTYYDRETADLVYQKFQREIDHFGFKLNP
jgi:hypothetical protein